MYLSKSAFKTARDCPAKLYYSKNGYPSTLEKNTFLQYLAEGGFVVEKMAQLLFPGGVEAPFGLRQTEEAWAFTRDWVQSVDSGVLFEAVILNGDLMARVDILEKRGTQLFLHEVKSISGDRSEGEKPFQGKRGGLLSNRRAYVEDICFQALVAEKAFPNLKIEADLCIVDKSARVQAHALMDCFELSREETGGFQRPLVHYHGDVEALRQDHPLWFVDMTNEVDHLREELLQDAERFAASLQGDPIRRLPGTLGPSCAKCEFRAHSVEDLQADPQLRDGFRECWGERALCEPHILDLRKCRYYPGMGNLCTSGDPSLLSLDVAAVKGKTGERQAIQLEYTRKNQEYIDPELPGLLKDHEYPLHFIDFETTRTALPYHAGMRPYELITFQWSCHTLREPGGRLEHSEWLHEGEGFPNFEFARSLREAIGDEGTVYIWSHHEHSCMNAVAKQLEAADQSDPELEQWLYRFEEGRGSRVIDLCQLAEKHYFHPEMKGSCSIKAVLPAIWQNQPTLWEDPDFADYVSGGGVSPQEDPYHQLPALELSDGTCLSAVHEGTGAIRAYEDLCFGPAGRDEERKRKTRALLRQYCQLDTAAMVMIWKHWVQSDR